ncbi:MAG: hypothetical protein JNM77_18840 [Pseudonocardia sp.]|nr:hypothetical protein [Pseudonocardia sp.]
MTGSQTALAEFLRLDGDLLDAAADGSTIVSRSGPDVAAWVTGLPARERDALLVEQLRGDVRPDRRPPGRSARRLPRGGIPPQDRCAP